MRNRHHGLWWSPCHPHHLLKSNPKWVCHSFWEHFYGHNGIIMGIYTNISCSMVNFYVKLGGKLLSFHYPPFSNEIDFWNHFTNPSTKVLSVITHIIYHLPNFSSIFISHHLLFPTIYHQH